MADGKFLMNPGEARVRANEMTKIASELETLLNDSKVSDVAIIATITSVGMAEAFCSGIISLVDLSCVSKPVFGTPMFSSSFSSSGGINSFKYGMMLSGMWPTTSFSAFETRL